MSFESLLEQEIISEIENLDDMEAGTEQHKTAVESVTKLMDKAIEIKKIDIEHKDRVGSSADEIELRLKQMEEEKKDRLIKNILAGAGVIIPVAVTVWGTYKTLKFEEEGTVTTMMGRGFIQKLLPKQK